MTDKLPNFENDLIDLFGERIRNDDAFAKRIYAALTNIIWKNGAAQYAGTFRYAGGLIADIRGEGSYLDWYCAAREGVVDADIAEALLIKGWTPHQYDI